MRWKEILRPPKQRKETHALIASTQTQICQFLLTVNNFLGLCRYSAVDTFEWDSL